MDCVAVDTNQCIKYLINFNETHQGDIESSLLVTWDLENMFPSIDNSMGLAACRTALDSRPYPNPPTNCIIDALTIVLETNILFFNNRIYKQISGTAMGPNHACSFADIIIGPIDKSVMSCISTGTDLKCWIRFRDDILFTIWKGIGIT